MGVRARTAGGGGRTAAAATTATTAAAIAGAGAIARGARRTGGRARGAGESVAGGLRGTSSTIETLKKITYTRKWVTFH